MSREMWLPVLGYEGSYEVSSCGQVRSLDRVIVDRNGVRRRLRGRVKGQYLDPESGYLRVNLGNGTTNGAVRKVHQLVAEAFLGPRPPGLLVRHLNGNPVDNRVRNLRWGTYAENSADTVQHGRNRNAAKTHCEYGHPLTAPNLVESADKGKGHRACLACHRARASVSLWQRKGVTLDHQAVADQHFNGEPNLYLLGVPSEGRDPTVQSKNQYSGKYDCIRGHRLAAPNLVRSQAAKGVRACRACHRGRALVRYHAKAGRSLDMQVAADQCYRKIMGGHGGAFRPTELCECGDIAGECFC